MSDAILVTGGGGFVGSAVVRRLAQAIQAGSPPRFGDGAIVGRVVALLRHGGSTERLRELPASRAWSIEHADLTDRGELGQALKRVAPRAIFHLALPDDGARAPVATLETLFQALADVPGARLIHTGSAWVLASGSGLDERAPTDPRSAYARAKLLEDEALPALGARAGVEWINLRLFNVFGKYERPSRLIPHLVERLARGEPTELSHGSQVRDFTDVDAIAGAYPLALRADPAACGALYHVGSGLGTTARELALAVAALVGSPSLLRFGDARTADDGLPCLVAEPRRAREVLGWVPPTDLGAAVERVVAWWLERLDPGHIAEPGARRASREDALL